MVVGGKKIKDIPSLLFVTAYSLSHQGKKSQDTYFPYLKSFKYSKKDISEEVITF